jgi:hypothetical protein
MPIEDRIETPPPADAPKALDLAKCQKLIAAADKYRRLPTGDLIQEYAEQLKLATAELGGVSTKIVNAQNEALRYQRETENANRDLNAANIALLGVRGELRMAQGELAALKPKEEANPAAADAPKKRGRPAKVVPIKGPDERVAQ